jgi:hypothetical protein
LLPHADKVQKEVDRGFFNWLRIGLLFRMAADFSAYYGEQISLEKIFPIFIEHPAFHKLRFSDYHHKFYTKRMLRDLWEEYRKVAHLCAALSWLAIKNPRHYFQWKTVGIEPFSPEHRLVIMAQFFLRVETLEHLANYGNYLAFMQKSEFVQTRLTKKSDLFAFLSLAKLNHDLVLQGISKDMYLGMAREYQRFGLAYKAKQSPHPLLPDDIWKIPEEWNLINRPLPISIPHPSMRAIYEHHAQRKKRG